MIRNVEHENAERCIFSYLIEKRSFFLKDSNSLKRINISKVFWEERTLPDSRWRCDMVLIDNDGKEYFLEIINTNQPKIEKINYYILSKEICGIYINIKHIISNLPLEKQSEAIISYIEKNGFKLFF